jgi:hypothetical protein
METEYLVYFEQIFRSIGYSNPVQFFVLPMIESVAALVRKTAGQVGEFH